MNRLSVLWILFKFVSLVRSLAVPWILLFVVNGNSTSAFAVYGRMILVALSIAALLNIVLQWATYRYKFGEDGVVLKKGLFTRTTKTIPYVNIQNYVKKRTFLHRLIGVTGVHFEAADDGSSFSLEVIRDAEVAHIERKIAGQEPGDRATAHDADKQLAETHSGGAHEDDNPALSTPEPSPPAGKTLHFQPDRRELWKAAFTSFSFLVIIPVAITLYNNLEHVLDLDPLAESTVERLLQQPLLASGVIGLLLLIAIIAGIIRTYVKYGNDKILSDERTIYLHKGTINETRFTISKAKVEAVEVRQSMLKRWFGLAEVRIVAASGSDKDVSEARTLYPYLPKQRAVDIIHELLPDYVIEEDMKGLPARALIVRFVNGVLLGAVAALAAFLFRAQFPFSWWWAAAGAVCVILLGAYLSHKHTLYALSERMIQVQKGIWTTKLILVKRSKVTQIKVKRTPLQRKLGLAAFVFSHRSVTTVDRVLADIPLRVASDLFAWYRRRYADVKLLKSGNKSGGS